MHDVVGRWFYSKTDAQRSLLLLLSFGHILLTGGISLRVCVGEGFSNIHALLGPPKPPFLSASYPQTPTPALSYSLLLPPKENGKGRRWRREMES